MSSIDKSHYISVITGIVTGVSLLLLYQNVSRNKNKNTLIRTGYGAMIGDTKLVKLNSLSKLTQRDIYVKCENLNPGSTGKDRIALAMIEEAENCGLLKKNGTVIEGTSGSTGIALAAICASKGYKCIVVLPDDQAKEKSDLIKMYGGQVYIVKTAAISNPDHYVNYAKKLSEEIPGSVFMNQFENLANYKIHLNTTGPEIFKQMNGNIDAFIMSAGTGGTIGGISQYLKLKTNNKVKIILADPPGSSLLNYVLHGICWNPKQSERKVKKHRYDTIVEGIGLDRITSNMSKGIIDYGIQISDQDAINIAHYIMKNEGICLGSSSSMNIAATIIYAKLLPQESQLVTVLCDSGQRHMTRFWNPEFIKNESKIRDVFWPTEQEAEDAVHKMIFERVP